MCVFLIVVLFIRGAHLVEVCVLLSFFLSFSHLFTFFFFFVHDALTEDRADRLVKEAGIRFALPAATFIIYQV